MTQICDFSKLPKPLSKYTWATDVMVEEGSWAVVLRESSRVTHEPVVFRSTNKFDVRLAIREANEILSAIHRLKGQNNAQ